MSQIDPNRTTENEEHPSYTPASVEKRIAAWVGIVYALIFGFIITFSMYRPDRSLAGTFPLLLVPVSIGIIVLSIYKQYKGTARSLLSTVVTVLICLVVTAFALWLGVPVLAVAFGG